MVNLNPIPPALQQRLSSNASLNHGESAPSLFDIGLVDICLCLSYLRYSFSVAVDDILIFAMCPPIQLVKLLLQ